MNSINLRLFAIAFMALAITACNKDDDTPINSNNGGSGGTNPSTYTSLNSFFRDNFNNMKQTFTIDAANPQVITANQGTVIQFAANSFVDANNNVVSGNVDISLVEIYNKSDMIFTGAITQSNGQPLVSGGEFAITASQNGNQLNLAPNSTYRLEAPAPNGTTTDMTIFTGNLAGNQAPSVDTSLNWSIDSSRGGVIDSLSNNKYFCLLKTLNWINCDYFYSDPRPKTSLKVQLPTGYTGNNAAVFLSFDGLSSISNLHDNNANGEFTTSYQFPIGLQLHVISMSLNSSNQFVTDITPVTVTANHVENITALNPTTATQFATAISNLP